MKKTITIILMILSISAFAQPTDTIKIISSLQKEVANLSVSVSHLQKEVAKQNLFIKNQSNTIDSLIIISGKQEESVQALAKKTGAEISGANKKIEENTSTLSDSIDKRSWTGLLAIIFTVALFIIAYIILRRKISKSSSAINKIKDAQNSLDAAQKAMQEESVKLDSKLVEMLDKQIGVKSQSNKEGKPDHSFALKVGDEIAKIETNLSKMDPDVKGYKQLKQALKRIKDNFNAHGYEIVELLGLDYNEGMPFEAQFVPDDTIPEGKRIISGITRLQINYNGEMIQSAKITVRQNI